MDLQYFLTYVHNGAFSLFEQIIIQLTKPDLKALRLVLDRLLSDAIYPYLFNRLFFSVHEYDQFVFEKLVNRPGVSKNITRISWDDSNCIMASVERNLESYRSTYIYLLRYSDSRKVDVDTLNKIYQMPQEERTMFLEAVDVWVDQGNWQRRNINLDLDMQVLREAFPKLTNLRRIETIARYVPTHVSTSQYLKAWNTPRARFWARLPFRKYLMDPKPCYAGEVPNTMERTWKHLKTLVKEGQIQIGSLIIESFGYQVPPEQQRGPDLESGIHRYPQTDFEKIADGFGSTVPDLPDSTKLTLRLMIEKQPRSDSLYARLSRDLANLGLLIIACRSTVQEITYSGIYIEFLMMFDQLDQYPLSGACSPSGFRSLRTIRLHNCSCTDISKFLKQLWEKSTAREIELHSISSNEVSWYNAMMELKKHSITFNVFEVVSCRSPSDWGPGFEPEMLAPWNGESKETVPWLKGETDKFPLWQGPG